MLNPITVRSLIIVSTPIDAPFEKDLKPGLPFSIFCDAWPKFTLPHTPNLSYGVEPAAIPYASASRFSPGIPNSSPAVLGALTGEFATVGAAGALPLGVGTEGVFVGVVEVGDNTGKLPI